MKKSFVKLISILIAVLLLTTALPFSASAETSGYYTYSIWDGEAEITGCSTSISGDITIPSTLGGYPVTSIGDYAFYGCSSLKSINIPDGVTSIGDYAFFHCDSLTSINIPDGVTSIDVCAFYNTAYYKDESNWENGVLYINNHLIAAKSDLSGEYKIKAGTRTIADYAFSDCSRLTSITIPDSVTSIGDWAFLGCSSLTEINVESGNTEYCDINGVLFNKSCTTLIKYPARKSETKYDIPDRVTSIGELAFFNCSSLTSVKIGNSVTSIGYQAFSGCSGLTSITIPNSVTSIGWYAFYDCSSLTSITIPDSVTSIGGYAFYDCSSLTSITIPNSVTSIGDWAFSGCSSLTSITIPNSVTSIGSSAFSGCSSLTSITIPGSATYIGSYAIPKTAKIYCRKNSKAESYAKSNGNEYSYIICNQHAYGEYNVTVQPGCTTNGEEYRVCEICDYVETHVIAALGHDFSDTFTVDVPATDFSEGSKSKHCSRCDEVTEVTVIPRTSVAYGDCGENVKWSLKEDGTLIICGTGAMYNYEYPSYAPWYSDDNIRKSIKKVVISSGVASLGSYAFFYCSSLTSVTIPDSVTSIGDHAFCGCSSLTSVKIGNSVTSIGVCAFEYCSSLTSITIPDSVTSIGYSAFHYCSSLISITIPDGVTSIGDDAFRWCSGLTSITIPGSVTSIGNWAFSYCSSLTSITIPDSVTSIGDYAFSGCSNLTKLIIADGSTQVSSVMVICKRQLKEIVIPDSVTSIGDGAFKNCTSLTSITIPDSVTSIGDKAFSGCSSLTSITLPDSVTNIGSSAFSGCSSLTSITIPDSVTTIGTSAIPKTAKIYCHKNSAAESYAKSNGNEYEYICNHVNVEYKVTVQPGCTTKGEEQRSCEICDYVVTHIIPALGHDFSDTFTVDVPATDFSEGSKSKHCSRCDEVTEVTVIPRTSVAYGNCGENIEWALNKDGTLIIRGTGAMYDYTYSSNAPWCSDSNIRKSIKKVIISCGVASVGDWAFSGCKSLTSVTIPDSVASIGDWAFGNCEGLTNITLPDSVTSIGAYAFAYTAYYNNQSNWQNGVLYINDHLITASENLSGEYKIKYGIRTIADHAFDDCTELTGITIPNSVTAIGKSAIPNTAKIYCNKNTEAESYAKSNGIEYAYMICEHVYREYTVTVQPDCTTSGEKQYICTICGNTETRTVAPLGHTYGEYTVTVQPGCTTSGEEQHICTICGHAESRTVAPLGHDFSDTFTVDVPATDFSEGSKSKHCSRCDEVTEVTVIPRTSVAYGDCGENVKWALEEDGTLIICGTGAMYDYKYSSNAPWCSDNNIRKSIKKVIISSGVAFVGDWAFWNCTGLTSVTIPNSVTSIGYYTFYNCKNLTSVTIPDSVTSIGDGAFENCSSLKNAFYTGTEQQWKNIDIGYDNDCMSNSEIVSAPTVQLIGATKLAVKATEGYEYSIDGKVWQSGNLFTGLIPGSSYVIYQRRIGSAETTVCLGASVITNGQDEVNTAPNSSNLVVLRKALISDFNNMALDYNADGEINILDFIRLKKYLCGMNVMLGNKEASILAFTDVPTETNTQSSEIPISEPYYSVAATINSEDIEDRKIACG